MKKVVMLVIAVLILAVAGSAMAGISGSLKGAAGGVVKGAASSGINKELGKSEYQCMWNKSNKNVDGCDLKKIAAYLSGQRTVAEKGSSEAGHYSDYNINIHAKDYDAFAKVKKQLQTFGVGSWDIDQKTEGVSGDQVKFSVAIE